MEQDTSLHVSECPQRDVELPFPEGEDRAYAIIQNGCRELLFFSQRGRFFIQARGKRVVPFSLLNHWSGEESILACLGGVWVFSSASRSDGSFYATVFPTQADVAAVSEANVLLDRASLSRSTSVVDCLKRIFRDLI